jgi:hypothetical protein
VAGGQVDDADLKTQKRKLIVVEPDEAIG